MAQDPTGRDRPQSFLYIRVNGRAFIYSNGWTPTPYQLNRSPEMGGFKKCPGDSNVRSGRVERSYRAELLILYAQIIGDLVKELTDSATHRSGEPKMPHY